MIQQQISSTMPVVGGLSSLWALLSTVRGLEVKPEVTSAIDSSVDVDVFKMSLPFNL